MITHELHSRRHSDSMTAMALFAGCLVVGMVWWGFAFFPFDAVNSDLLARAQAVCFGSLPNGLPGPQGWVLLLLGPPALAIAVWVSHSSEVKEGWKKVFGEKKYLLHRAAMILLAFLCLGEAIWVLKKLRAGLGISTLSFNSTEKGPLPDHYPTLQRPLPAISLTNQKGDTFTPKSFQGKTTLLTFTFGHCTTVCPAIISQVGSALKLLDSTRVQAVFISIDPWRDTVRSLPSIAMKWDLPSNAHFLSGEIPLVTQTLDRLELPWQRDERTGDVQHPPLVYVVNEQGKIHYAFNNPPTDWLVTAVQRIQKAASQ